MKTDGTVLQRRVDFMYDTFTNILIYVIVILLEAASMLGASVLICKYTKIKEDTETRFYFVFNIVNAVLLALVAIFVAVCLIFKPSADASALGAVTALYGLPPLVIMQIIGLASILVKKNSEKSIDRMLSNAEAEIENLLKNSDKINKDKT